MTRTSKRLVAACWLAWACSATAYATDYYVDNLGGSDNNAGTSISAPWASLSKVNGATLAPGDTVSFKRGGTWRGGLVTKGGTQGGGAVRYGAYGAGVKPRLLGSASLSDPADWAQTGLNIWTSQVAPVGPQLLTDPNFDGPALPTRWTFSSKIAGTSLEPNDVFPASSISAPNPNSLKISMNGTSTVAGSIDLYTNVFPVTNGACYKLSFAARATIPMSVAWYNFKLWQSVSYASMADQLDFNNVNIGTAWGKYELYFRGTATDSSVRAVFRLGASAVADQALYIDSASVTGCDEQKRLVAEVGNLIFDDEQSVATRVWNEADLIADGQYWYDPVAKVVKLYATHNPASTHTRIEAAMKRNLVTIAKQTDVEVRDLDLRYGALHGVQTSDVQRVLIDNLDIAYMGGAQWQNQTRLGNGIELWSNAADVTVSNNRISQAFDTALTSQGIGPKIVVSNVHFLNNLVESSEQCFELWNRPDVVGESTTKDLTFAHNTCLHVGTGWSHTQRPVQDGSDLLMYRSPAPMTNIHMINNIFYGAVNYFIHLNTKWNGYTQIDLSGNCYYPAAGALLLRAGDETGATSYSTAAGLVSVLPGAATSMYVDPQLVAGPSGILVPNPAGPCAAKGYVPPSI
ncbi:right-handed parallel beta-helix repeat-containing protein [Duganella sp. S19_KUP01_CR8]|uniref:right-handed parallel beta-helix repeat-containing protein n=1 Tax=Duganella sp. S19_KUP01_CR8 TaxID=3025502 RepID=UPI002FCDAE8E